MAADEEGEVMGAPATPSGSHPTGHAAVGVDGASRFDPSREEFCERFKARMLARAGPTFDDGGSIAEYADMAAPTYFDDPDQRAEGPEECADTDISYWGDE